MVHILIVEDELPISDLLETALSKSGYRCTCACDGMEAANLIEKGSYDLILLDIMLPGAGHPSVMQRRPGQVMSLS